MENSNSESYLVLNVNHPPFDLKNKVDEELQNVNSEESEIKIKVDENKNKNRNQLRIKRPQRQPILNKAVVDDEDSKIKIERKPESPSLKELLTMINEFFRTLVENTKSIKGAKVENHKLFVSLNYRNVDEKDWPTMSQCVLDVLKNYPCLELTHQLKVLEVRPVIDWFKGTSFEFLFESLRQWHSDSDDRTDEDSFNSNKLYIGKISREQTFAVINFIIEVPTLVFEQLSSKNQMLYGILAMSFSILTLIFSIAEFIYGGRKARAVWRWRRIPWLYYSSPSYKTKLFGSATDVIGLLSAILQCIFSGIAFYFYNRHKDNPVNISMWSPVFAFCVMWSKFLENSPDIMLPVIEQLQTEPLKMAPPLKKSR